MKKLSIAAVAALAALALASCGAGTIEGTAAKGQPAAAASSSSGAASAPSEEPAAEETPAAPDHVKFGETWKWDDGTQITVSKPVKFTPSVSAMGGSDFKTRIQFTITIKNGSKEKLELFGTPNVMSGDTEGDPVFDTAKGLNGAPDSKVQPGRSVKFKVGYGVKDMNDLVLEYAPTMTHDEATFTSK